MQLYAPGQELVPPVRISNTNYALDKTSPASCNTVVHHSNCKCNSHPYSLQAGYYDGQQGHQGYGDTPQARGRGRGYPNRHVPSQPNHHYAAQQVVAQQLAMQQQHHQGHHFPSQPMPGQQQHLPAQQYLTQQLLGQHQPGSHHGSQHGSQQASPQHSPQALHMPAYPDVQLPR